MIPRAAHAGIAQRPPSMFSYTADDSRELGLRWRTQDGWISSIYFVQKMVLGSSLTGGLTRAS